MNLMDVISILIILLFMVLGFKKGVIKSLVQLVGTCAVLVLAFVFKDFLANFLMSFLPFFNFGGLFEGISSINILMYELISFVILYVLFYCILSIIINLAGLVEKILKFTVILAIPSKILGAILGLVEGIIMAFLILFILFHLPQTENMVAESKFAIIILERTPVIGNVAANTTQALEEIVVLLNEMQESNNREQVDANVLTILQKYGIINTADAKKLQEEGKIKLENVIIEEVWLYDKTFRKIRGF